MRSSSVLRLISSCCLHVAQEPAIIAHFLHSAIAERRNDEATAAKSRGTARDTFRSTKEAPTPEGREGFGSIRNGSCHIQREAPVSRVPAGVSGLNSTGPACALENNRDACGFRNTKVADITDVSASASQLSTLHSVQRIRRPLALTKALGLRADNGLVQALQRFRQAGLGVISELVKL